MNEIADVGMPKEGATKPKIQAAMKHIETHFPPRLGSSVHSLLQQILSGGMRDIIRSQRLRSNLRDLVDRLNTISPGSPEEIVRREFQKVEKELELILAASKLFKESVRGNDAVDMASRNHVKNLAAQAVADEVKLHESTYSQAKAMLMELRAGINRLSEAEDESRRRSSSLVEEVSASLARINDAEAESRKMLQNWHAEYGTLQSHIRTEFEGDLERARSLVEDLSRYRTEAKELLKVVGENGASAGYRNEAEKSKRSRSIWQVLTVVFFGMWILASAGAFYLTKDMELTWALAARQFVVSLPFVLLSAFGALQVSRANATDLSNQRAALEIHALGPLLAGLPDDDQRRVRGAIIPRFFGTEPSMSELAGRQEANSTQDATAVLGKIAELLKMTSK